MVFTCNQNDACLFHELRINCWQCKHAGVFNGVAIVFMIILYHKIDI